MPESATRISYPASGCVAGDPDPGLGWRERGGVVEQLGDEVPERRCGEAGHLDVIECEHVDASVVLDLGDAGAYDLVDVLRRPNPGPIDSGEHEQAVGVPAHPGREVVELEVVGQEVGILDRQFERVEERQLLIDEPTVASGERHDERRHRVGVAAGTRSGLVADRRSHR